METPNITTIEAIALISLVSQHLEVRGGECDKVQLSVMGKALACAHNTLTEQNQGEIKE